MLNVRMFRNLASKKTPAEMYMALSIIYEKNKGLAGNRRKGHQDY
jgi:hypothetical protein